MNPERRGKLETTIHYFNYVDLGFIVGGLLTNNPAWFVWGIAGFAGGKVAENWLKNRKMKSSFA